MLDSFRFRMEEHRLNKESEQISKLPAELQREPLTAYYKKTADYRNRYASWQSRRLTYSAAKMDLEVPAQNEEGMWEDAGPMEPGSTWRVRALTRRGRIAVRKLIDEEKTRRFEVKVRWVKLLTPIITSLIGLLGVLIGLVFALKK